jgi:parallel beta-helix repeat protein
MKVFALAMIALCLWCASPTQARADTCVMSDTATMRDCFRNPSAHERFVLAADVTCTRAADCCADGGRALMTLVGGDNKTIDGQGYRFSRMAGQKSCPALLLHNLKGITVRNLTVDDGQAAPPCKLSDKPCAPAVDIATSSNVLLDGLKVSWANGYAVQIWNVQGVVLRQSAITDAGIIGVYIGHYRYGGSSNVTIANNTIERSRTNGLVVQGGDDVSIEGNTFIGNHWHGLWPVPRVQGGITPGGQVLIAAGQRIIISGNKFDGSNCGNCRPSNFVPAIEVGESAEAPGVQGLKLSANLFCHKGEGFAVWQNPGSKVTGVDVEDNRVNGFAETDNITGPTGHARNQLGLKQCS